MNEEIPVWQWVKREEDLAAGRITREDIENERKAKAEAKAKAYVAALEADVVRLRKALEFYANPINYRSYWHEGRLPIIDDLGKTAQAALKESSDG